MTPPVADVTLLPDLRGLPGLLSDRVYQALRTAILSLEFPPGAVLRKGDICDQLGVSRTPVSDAIQKLSGEGLVDVVPQSTTQVTKLSMTEIREDAFLREALEVAAAERAAEQVTEALAARLERSLSLQQMQVDDRDFEEFHRADQVFHRLILDSTGIARLPGAVQAVSNQVDRARLLILPEAGSRDATIAEHRDIVEGIRSGNARGAGEAMRAHLRRLLTRLAPLEAQRPELFRP